MDPFSNDDDADWDDFATFQETTPPAPDVASAPAENIPSSTQVSDSYSIAVESGLHSTVDSESSFQVYSGFDNVVKNSQTKIVNNVADPDTNESAPLSASAAAIISDISSDMQGNWVAVANAAEISGDAATSTAQTTAAVGHNEVTSTALEIVIGESDINTAATAAPASEDFSESSGCGENAVGSNDHVLALSTAATDAAVDDFVEENRSESIMAADATADESDTDAAATVFTAAAAVVESDGRINGSTISTERGFDVAAAAGIESNATASIETTAVDATAATLETSGDSSDAAAATDDIAVDSNEGMGETEGNESVCVVEDGVELNGSDVINSGVDEERNVDAVATATLQCDDDLKSAVSLIDDAESNAAADRKSSDDVDPAVTPTAVGEQVGAVGSRDADIIIEDSSEDPFADIEVPRLEVDAVVADTPTATSIMGESSGDEFKQSDGARAAAVESDAAADPFADLGEGADVASVVAINASDIAAAATTSKSENSSGGESEISIAVESESLRSESNNITPIDQSNSDDAVSSASVVTSAVTAATAAIDATESAVEADSSAAVAVEEANNSSVDLIISQVEPDVVESLIAETASDTSVAMTADKDSAAVSTENTSTDDATITAFAVAADTIVIVGNTGDSATAAADDNNDVDAAVAVEAGSNYDGTRNSDVAAAVAADALDDADMSIADGAATASDAIEADATIADATIADATIADATAVDATAVDATAVDATETYATAVDATAVNATEADATAVDATTVVATSAVSTITDAVEAHDNGVGDEDGYIATTGTATAADPSKADATTTDATATVPTTTLEAQGNDDDDEEEWEDFEGPTEVSSGGTAPQFHLLDATVNSDIISPINASVNADVQSSPNAISEKIVDAVDAVVNTVAETTVAAAVASDEEGEEEWDDFEGAEDMTAEDNADVKVGTAAVATATTTAVAAPQGVVVSISSKELSNEAVPFFSAAVRQRIAEIAAAAQELDRAAAAADAVNELLREAANPLLQEQLDGLRAISALAAAVFTPSLHSDAQCGLPPVVAVPAATTATVGSVEDICSRNYFPVTVACSNVAATAVEDASISNSSISSGKWAARQIVRGLQQHLPADALSVAQLRSLINQQQGDQFEVVTATATAVEVTAASPLRSTAVRKSTTTAASTATAATVGSKSTDNNGSSNSKRNADSKGGRSNTPSPVAAVGGGGAVSESELEQQQYSHLTATAKEFLLLLPDWSYVLTPR